MQEYLGYGVPDYQDLPVNSDIVHGHIIQVLPVFFRGEDFEKRLIIVADFHDGTYLGKIDLLGGCADCHQTQQHGRQDSLNGFHMVID